MSPVPLSVAISSFAVAAAAYLLMLVLILPLRPHTRISKRLLGAVAATALWALALIAISWSFRTYTDWIPALDALHLAAWVLFVTALIRVSGVTPTRRIGRVLGYASVLGSLAVIALNVPWIASEPRVRYAAILSLPLAGLLGLEQVFRNATYEERGFLKPLAIGVGSVFAIDIFVYSQSVLFGTVAPLPWALRGFANAAVVPLLLVAAKRSPNWGETLFVSRQVVYYSTTLTAVGLYLLAMGFGGYLIGASQLSWGTLLQTVFLVLAGCVLVFILFSQALRNRLRVFIAKHFYRNRYDYREEWLRLMHTLGSDRGLHSLPERCVKALADIIGSPRGELWLLDRQRSAFDPRASWGAETATRSLGSDDVLVKFMRDTRWVIDTAEYRRDPEKYSNAFASTDYAEGAPAIFVPLIHDDSLAGIVRLERPPGIGDLGYEDHDLLKTAGQQAAIFLIQERDQEELSQTRQFEAYSRLTAFLMHDLKNIIAQQELLIGNAKRFKQRPEFIDDAIDTIEGTVQRMRKVLDRLQSARGHDVVARVDLVRVAQDVIDTCADRRPAPKLRLDCGAAWVSLDRDKVAMAITNAIRNAQDATDGAGSITLRLASNGSRVEIEVEDTGAGMEEEFIRESLFKPFHTTKGAKGMGIGAYQLRETFRGAGGDVEVTSAVGRGTCLRMWLPLLTEADLAAEPRNA